MSEILAGLQVGENMQMVASVAREFAEREIRPAVMKYDEPGEYPHEIMAGLAELGFLGAVFPERYGGAGLSLLDFTAIVEEISRVDPSVALNICAHSGLCTSHILRFGSEEQKGQYLPDLCSGRKLGGWGLTEPCSGSDASSMQTVAVRDGGDWILRGGKAFITHGSVGSTFVVMAVTDKSTPRPGISAFIVEKGMPGFSAGRKESKLGMRASDTASLMFDGTRVPGDNLIGCENEGFRQAMDVLDGGRIGIAALAVGLAQGALDASIRYVQERRQFGRPLAEFQGIRWKLAEMATGIEAARLLTRKAALLRARGEDVNLAAAQAKFFASEHAVRAAGEAVQIHGGYGFTKDFPVEKLFRDAKLLTIGEGTSEIQRTIIAKNILK